MQQRMSERVPHGYELPADKRRGTLIYYDPFEETTDEEMVAAATALEDRAFAKLVSIQAGEATRPMRRRGCAAHLRLFAAQPLQVG